jgi:starch phosphorylase
VEEKVASENITKVLYPNDEKLLQGKQLRLEQQYFFVSCSLQDMIRFCRGRVSPRAIPRKVFHSAQRHPPSGECAELMRLLLDEHGLAWEPGLDVTQKTFAYTNHTLLPEALEKWPLSLFGEAAAPPSRNHL